MSTSTTTTPATPIRDGILRASDLSHLDPADTLTFDHSVAQIFRSATRPGGAPHPDRDQAVATILLLAAANSVRERGHYRQLAHSPRFGSPWDLPRIECYMNKDIYEDLVRTDSSALLRRAKVESWLRRHNEDLTSEGAAAARKFLADHEGLAEKLGPVVVAHFIRAASILPPPVPGVADSPAPSHKNLLRYIGEVGGLSALDMIDNITIEISTGQIADRARTIPGLAGVEIDRLSVLLSTRSRMTAKICGSQRGLTLQGVEGARNHSTIPVRRQFPNADGIYQTLCRALTEHAGDPRLLRQAELADTVSRLTNLRAIDRQSVNAARTSIPELRSAAATATRTAQKIAEALETLRAPSPTDLDGLLTWVRTAMVTRSRNAYDTTHSATHACGSLRLDVRLDSAAPRTVKLTLSHAYLPLISDELVTKKLGTDPAKAAAKARKTVLAMVEALPGRRKELLASATRSTERAAAAEALVESYCFSRQDELDAALNELEQISRALEYAAEEANAA